MIQCPKCSAENPPDNKFCGSCGEPFSSISQMPTVAAPEPESPQAPVKTPHVGRIVSSDSVPTGGFTPGTILADRYRVIGLLGRGGMGEVYRADDLKLGQPVALKFLPPKLSDDPVRRERFFAEVRITRQLSHPNICRVYDIGEVDGRHFLSMEYIDGEDLASLMKRIGHLSNEKALDIARQLVAGLTVAHERGVLHRDLKPANIMLDGHGRVRITDFGLAIVAEDETQEEIAGTPAYMAPEQLAGKGATVRSDIYSLGLILYEIYTGKKAFKAETLAELREQKETQTPRAPSELRDGIDPVVERVIQRCMEKDPNARPASVAQLAQALPGGDPLAAAIAAGETPSPEMVAASGSTEGLRPRIAWGLLAFIILGTIAIIAMNDRVMLHRLIPFEKPPEALAERAQEFLKKAGYSEDYADSRYWFSENSDLLQHLEKTDKTADRWKNLDSQAILFIYRQSPHLLENHLAPNLTYNPPLQYSEEVLIVLDTQGQLVSLRAIPPYDRSPSETTKSPDWDIFFTEAGLEISQWEHTEPKRNPTSYADTIEAWQSKLQNYSETPVRIEASSFQGLPVSFEIMRPWTKHEWMEPVQPELADRFNIAITIVLLAVIIIGGLFFAVRNLRLGRGDRRNANRLALVIIFLFAAIVILNGDHVLTLWGLAMPLIYVCIAIALGGTLWILYIAIEPFVRRRWPQMMVSWTRLISGNWRDPLVGRDMFVGCAFGVLIICIYRFYYYLILPLLGYAGKGSPIVAAFDTLLGSNFIISTVLDFIITGLIVGLALLCFLFILRIVFRNQKIAMVMFVILLSSMNIFGGLFFIPLILIVNCLFLLLLIRFGIVSIFLASFTADILGGFPINFQAWYSPVGYMTLALLAAIVLYAFYTSLGGRPIFGTPRLDE